MRRILITASAVSSVLALVATTGAASAETHRRHHHEGYAYHASDRSDCWAEHHRSANTGTVLGAIGGGIIGNQLAGSGSRTTGTLLGAGGGAVVGHQLGAHSHPCH